MNTINGGEQHISLFEPGVIIAERYQVVNILGKGGMGMVLRVIDKALDNEPTALKILYPHFVKDPIVFARFKNEALVVRKLSHPNIVKIFDFGSAGKGYFFLSMELVQGYSLNERIYSSRLEELKFAETCRILFEIGQGLDYAHRKGVIHRDIKPDNILLTPGGELRITDFGLARSVLNDKGFTQTGETVGTPCYMAPEQIKNEKVDHRADIYSLGILAYEMATGGRPFENDSWFDLAKMHMTKPLPSFAAEHDLPTWFEDLVFQSAEKNPADRFQTVREFCDIIRSHVAPNTEPSGLSAAVFSATLSNTVLNKRAQRRLKGKLFKLGTAFGIGAGILAASLVAIRSMPNLQLSAISAASSIEKGTGTSLAGVKKLLGLSLNPSVELLEESIKLKDEQRADLIVASGIDLTSPDSTGEPLVFAALENRLSSVVKRFIGSRATETFPKSVGKDTLLTVSAELGVTELIKPLLDKGVDVNERDGLGRTALMIAAGKSELSAVQELIARGALVSLTDETPDALPVTIYAVNGGNQQILEAVLAKGGKAAANAGDAKRMSPLMYAAEAGNQDLIRALLSAGADPNQQNKAGKTFRDYLPSKLRREFITGTQPQQATASSETTLRLIGEPNVEWLLGRSTKIKSLQAVIRNVGSAKALGIKVTAIIPGGHTVPLTGAVELGENGVSTFQASLSEPMTVTNRGPIEIKVSCENCRR